MHGTQWQFVIRLTISALATVSVSPDEVLQHMPSMSTEMPWTLALIRHHAEIVAWEIRCHERFIEMRRPRLMLATGVKCGKPVR